MSNRYSIYLANKYGSTNTYAFFTSPPKSDSNDFDVYSNVWISKELANYGNMEVHIDKTCYAWCGTAPTTLAPGVQVSQGNSRPAELGDDNTGGSSFFMYNLNSQPAFKDPEGHTAKPGCYEIDSGTDFGPDLNFLMGMAAQDSESRMVPVASFEAPRYSKVNIKPHVDYYIGAFAMSPGTTIDFTSQSAEAAHINFTQHPGLYGAIVTQNPDGDFTVVYAESRDEYLDLISSHEQGGSTLEQKVNKLAEQLSTVMKYLPPAAAAELDLSQVVSKKATKVTKRANGY